MKIKQQLFKELLEIAELWSDIPIAQHFKTIMRPNKDAYDWSDKLFLKKIEKYRDELEKISSDTKDDEFDNFNDNF